MEQHLDSGGGIFTVHTQICAAAILNFDVGKARGAVQQMATATAWNILIILTGRMSSTSAGFTSF